ncbi:MAG: DNA methylase [Lachnospiraceae bacterium]|nr:DNA methylase [Lachnospiraceae bacterium]
MDRVYAAIDLKSFYASVECVERKVDPLSHNLVVADRTRTDKTICLAVSPGLKFLGLPGRPRLFEVVQTVRAINESRRLKLPGHKFTGKSRDINVLNANPSLEVDYTVACPRMALYIKYSTIIYSIYLKYIAPEDIHVYSCDEVFMDLTRYLSLYHKTPRELVLTMIKDVLSNTGITATAGIGTNLFLSKVAMDIVAKRMPADSDGVRIAELDEMSYRRELWNHLPLTDFWRVGAGTVRRLNRLGLSTMGDIAAFSEQSSDTLYQVFGVNAELLIDHAWGYEPCTMEYIKNYRAESNSLSSGQVLSRPYSFSEAAIIVREMTDLLCLDLVSKGVVTDQMVLTLGYEGDHEHAHGTARLDRFTASSAIITEAVMALYERISDPCLCVRRVMICAGHITREDSVSTAESYEQLSLFTDYVLKDAAKEQDERKLAREKAMQLASIEIKEKYGKNAILKGANLLEGAMTIERNRQIGGHKA